MSVGGEVVGRRQPRSAVEIELQLDVGSGGIASVLHLQLDVLVTCGTRGPCVGDLGSYREGARLGSARVVVEFEGGFRGAADSISERDAGRSGRDGTVHVLPSGDSVHVGLASNCINVPRAERGSVGSNLDFGGVERAVGVLEGDLPLRPLLAAACPPARFDLVERGLAGRGEAGGHGRGKGNEFQGDDWDGGEGSVDPWVSAVAAGLRNRVDISTTAGEARNGGVELDQSDAHFLRGRLTTCGVGVLVRGVELAVDPQSISGHEADVNWESLLLLEVVVVVAVDFGELHAVPNVLQPHLLANLVHVGEPVDDLDTLGRELPLGTLARALSHVISCGSVRGDKHAQNGVRNGEGLHIIGAQLLGECQGETRGILKPRNVSGIVVVDLQHGKLERCTDGIGKFAHECLRALTEGPREHQIGAQAGVHGALVGVGRVGVREARVERDVVDVLAADDGVPSDYVVLGVGREGVRGASVGGILVWHNVGLGPNVKSDSIRRKLAARVLVEPVDDGGTSVQGAVVADVGGGAEGVDNLDPPFRWNGNILLDIAGLDPSGVDDGGLVGPDDLIQELEVLFIINGGLGVLGGVAILQSISSIHKLCNNNICTLHSSVNRYPKTEPSSRVPLQIEGDHYVVSHDPPVDVVVGGQVLTAREGTLPHLEGVDITRLNSNTE